MTPPAPDPATSPTSPDRPTSPTSPAGPATATAPGAPGGREERTVRTTSGDVELEGTLLLPAAEGAVPAVLLVSGSGPIDRDGNHRRLRLDVQHQLAEALAGAGIASLRYDKRGVGASGGTFLAAGLHDNVDDAGAALEALRRQPGVDPDRLVVVGHSEGAVIAAALVGGRGARVAGTALLSPSARPGGDVLLWQAAAIAPTLPAPVRGLLRLLRVDLVTKVARNHDRVRATTTDVARIGLQRVNARWHREFLAHDPRQDLAGLRGPVLALVGGKDLQVSPEDLAGLAALVPGEVETVLLDDVSHVLRSQPGAATLRSYRRDVRRPVDPRVLDAVVGWTCRVVGGAAQRG